MSNDPAAAGSNGSRPLRWLLWGVLAVALIAVAVLFVQARQSRSHLPELFSVQPFALTNQLGKTTSLRELEGKVWVADIIFTRCGGPCPRMTEQIQKLQAAFPGSDEVQFVTLTTDPEYDTPEVLRRYSEKFNADPNRWHFLTGTKQQIREVAMGSLKLGLEDKAEAERENPNDLFIHSTTFILVDKFGKARGGAYESLEEGFEAKIVEDIRSLLKERR